jgi:ferredoxin
LYTAKRYTHAYPKDAYVYEYMYGLGGGEAGAEKGQGRRRDTMTASVHFHTDLYRRDALESTARRLERRVRVDLVESGAEVVARLEPLAGEADAEALCDEFCTEVFSATAKTLRDTAPSGHAETPGPPSDEPPWTLLSPLVEGAALGLGWVLESLSPIRSGAATMVLRHPRDGIARVAIRRNGGAPLGVAHTEHLDFLLMNGGGGNSETQGSIGRVLLALASGLQKYGNSNPDPALLASLSAHTEMQPREGPNGRGRHASAPATVHRIAPHIDREASTIVFDVNETGISRLALYDAVLAFADRCHIFLTRPDTSRIGLHIKPREEITDAGLRVLVRDITQTLNRVVRSAVAGSAPGAEDRHQGLPHLARKRIDFEPLLAELDAADAATLGLGFQPERGPGHENLRILNIRGTGACNSDCIFCIEKFNPTHRPMPNADATRQLILDSAGKFDMLFFASGEPTIHPKLFDYVELARSVGFTSFGMSSHFRTFADPRFALKTLEAGFEFFDIALHAADVAGQLDVNPIEDEGRSLFEALKGLAVLLRLADTLGARISITHKIVVSRLNVTQLEPIFRATYDRGVRHFIVQPVRSLGLAPERQAKLAITEEEMLPYLNDLLAHTQGLGATIKPYGFSRLNLFSGSHVETEQNRVKNIYGKGRERDSGRALPITLEERPNDGRHWVEVRDIPDGRFGFASDGGAPVLDDALQRGATLNFGCRMGSCGMCCARLLEGRVDQSTQIFLSEEQMQQGFVLLCQARPLSDVVVQLCTEDEIDQL